MKRYSRYSDNPDYGRKRYGQSYGSGQPQSRHSGRKRKRYDEVTNTKSKKRKIDADEKDLRNERLNAWKKKLEQSSIRKDVEQFENFKRKKPLSFNLKKGITLTNTRPSENDASIVPPPPPGTSSNIFSDNTEVKNISIVTPSEMKNESSCSEKKVGEEKEEEDPLEAYLHQIDQRLEKEKKMEENLKKSSVITFEDLFSGKQGNDDQNTEKEDEDGDRFHKMFIKAMKNDETGGSRELFQAEDSMVAEGVVEYEVEEPRVIKSTRKDLKKVDHSNIDYEPFQKVFYIPPRELASLSREEIKHRRSKLGKLKMKGKGIPCPVETWAQCGFDTITLRNLQDLNYHHPFPIQAQAIPLILSGRNMIGIAPTGSGKTIAFLLPLLRHVLAQRPLEQGDGPIGLILAPTRELAQQIHREAKKFADKLNVRCTCVYGGGSMSEQIAQLKIGSHIIVCTPGRMIDLLCANRGRVTNLRRVTYVVLDEADRMFDFGFGPQITRVLDNIRPDRQIVLFSATFPRVLEALARKILKNSVQLIVGGRSVANEKIRQFVEIRDERSKFLRLLELLGIWYGNGSILIFVKGKEETGTLFKDVFSAGYDALVLHSGMDQMDRTETLRQFKKGEKTVLIGTSLVARGIDVQDIELVINYNVPHHYEDYVHQVGRTARANREGTSYTFVLPSEEENSPELVRALKQSGNPVPDELLQMKARYLEKKKQGTAKKRHMLRGYFTSGFRFNKEEGALKNNEKEEQKKALGIDDDGNFVDSAQYFKTQHQRLSKNNASGGYLVVPPPQGEGPKLNETELKEMEKEKKRQEEINTARKAKIVSEMQQQQQVDMKNAGVTVITQALAFAKTLTIQASANQYANNQTTIFEDTYSSSIVPPPLPNKGNQRTSIELEINDYPQKARWMVTRSNSEALLKIVSEIPGTRVSTKGVYVSPGEVVPVGDQKLYLLIEGNSKDEVENVKLRILQVLKNAMEPPKPVKTRKKEVYNNRRHHQHQRDRRRDNNQQNYHRDRRMNQLKGYSVLN